jgi:DNA-binding beta-propeller fold protein YncE
MFAPSYTQNTYESIKYGLSGQAGVANLVDMKYIQLANSVFVLGDNLISMDAYTGAYQSTIYLSGNADSIEMEFNTFNSYLYCLSKTKIWVVDPVIGSLITSISLTSTAADMIINADNGDIYVTYEDSPTITIFDYTNAPVSNLSTPSGIDTRTGKMAYNEFEKDIYITTDAEILLRINGATRDIQTSYAIPGLTQSSIFYEPAKESIYVYAQSQLWRIDNGTTASIPGMTMSEFVDAIYNNLTGEMNISDKTFRFRSLNLTDNSINIDRDPGIYGRMALNQYDGAVYLASDISKKVCVIDSANGAVVHTETTDEINKRIIYNPEDKSIWLLQPSASNVFVIRPTVNSTIEIIAATGSLIGEPQFGTLDPNYVRPPDVWIKAYECVRKPRENFEGEAAVKYYWKWLTDQTPEFFIYELSGEQLEKTGPYAYTGPKPFNDVPLNKYPNRDVTKVGLPEYQQTVFDSVEYQLSYIDDQDDVSTEPTPLQLFLGFKAPEEGAYSSYLQLYKKEEVEFSIASTPTNDTTVYFETLTDGYKRGRIKLNTMSEETFIGRGLKVGQYLGIAIKDITNTKNQHISPNSGYVVKISELYNKTMIVDFFNVDADFFESESTVMSDYPKTGETTYLKATFTVIDREIARFKTIGQTEIEDPRFKIELGNVGKNIGPNEIFIFKDYDILEGGVDWNFLNMKRKELLMMKHLIYP